MLRHSLPLRLPHNQFEVPGGHDGFDGSFVRDAFERLLALEQFNAEMHAIIGRHGKKDEWWVSLSTGSGLTTTLWEDWPDGN